MKNQTDIEIVSISPKNHILLSQNNIPNTTTEIVLSNTQPYPLAFPIKQNKKILFEVELSTVLTGELQGVSSIGVVLFSGAIKTNTVKTKGTFIPSNPSVLIHLLIHWQIVLESKETIPLGRTKIELYWLNTDHLSKSLYRKGVSLEVLRLMVDSEIIPSFPNHLKNKEIDNEYLNASQIITNAFNYIPPNYDIWNGASHFVTINGWNDITLHWRAFLTAHSYSPYSILNCYDAASVLQYWLYTYGYNSLFCFMQPFGYLFNTPLIGRGVCNNPFYGSTGGLPLVDPYAPIRTAFGNHAFLKLMNEAIADSCAGPHIGNEYIHQYIDNAVDRLFPFPPKVRKGTVNDVDYYHGVTHIDLISSINDIVPTPHLDELKNLINYTEPDWNSFSDESIVGKLPHPSTAKVLDLDWTELLEEVIPGESEVLKMWLFKNETGILTIKIFTISGKRELAHNRFLNLGTTYQTVNSPYKNGPDNLGDYSIQTSNSGYNRCITLFKNIVIEITNPDTKLNTIALSEFYHQWAEQHLVNELSFHMPKKGNLKLNIEKDLIKIVKNNMDNIILDFTNTKGCQLVEVKSQQLIFKKTENGFNITMLLIDNETLLVTSEYFR